MISHSTLEGRKFSDVVRRRFVLRLSLSLLLVFALSFLLGVRRAEAQTIYVVGANNTFGSFNLSTLAYTQISASLGGTNTFNLTLNGTGGFYGTQNTGTGNDTFVRITTGGAVTQIGAAMGVGEVVFGLARSASGTLYANGGNAATTGTVNPTTGVYTAIGAAGFTGTTQGGGDLAFSGSNLYAISSSAGGSLHTVNTTTGAWNAQIGVSDSFYSSGAVFSTGSALYVLNGTNVYSANTTTGVLSLLGALTGNGTTTSFYAASSLIAVPEPSTWAFLGMGAVGIGAFVWRRRRAEA